MLHPFAVKRGKSFTLFTHFEAACTFWLSSLGSVLMQRTSKGWQRTF